MSQIALHTPMACSGCYIQKVGMVHVDLEVARDCGVVTGPNGDPYPIDDLVLCKECVEDAARIIGLTRQEELEARLAEVLAERDAAVQIAASHRAYADQLEATLALKPQPVSTATRKKAAA